MPTEIKLANPQAVANYKGLLKLRREDVKTITIRGVKSYIFIEFEATNLPLIKLEAVGD